MNLGNFFRYSFNEPLHIYVFEYTCYAITLAHSHQESSSECSTSVLSKSLHQYHGLGTGSDPGGLHRVNTQGAST